mmetsp:Transcript_134486/g.339712  ORF Transcript_134486/g.339712 Transcript_134486/m.339712 type:complete len:262 (-) Transcript_134486:45-830(-)
MSAIMHVLKNMMLDHSNSQILYQPESYGAAGGELLVITMILSWALTYFFNHDVIESNPLKDRVGYNNLCVGWDTNPAKYVAAPLFAFIIFIESRYCQLDYWRAHLDISLRPFQRTACAISNAVGALSWMGAIGIFSINPMESATGHIASFVQLCIGMYICFACNFIETDVKYHPRGSWVFLGFFTVITIGFGICAMLQALLYDAENNVMGPVPWQVMCSLDYAYFACMALQGPFRPAAPSLTADYKLVSDDDFTVTTDPES